MAQEQQQVEISCGKGARTYATVVTARNLDCFLEAEKQLDVAGKSGEALVAALLAVAKGAITKVERIKDDKRNDGPNGEPAVQAFNDAGRLWRAERYKDDKRNDGPNGEPAMQDFNDAGALVYAEQWKDGKWNDGPNGEPAVQVFNDAGMLVHASRWKDDKRNDGPNDEPAVQEFNDVGMLVYAERWNDGKLVKKLSADEIRAWIEQQKASEKAAAG